MKNKIEWFFILLSNLFPLYGLFFLGWSPYETALVFWVETVVVFIFFLIKVLVRIFNRQWIAIILLLFAHTSLIFIFFHLMLSTLMFGTTGTSLEWGKMFFLISTGISAILPAIVITTLRYALDFIDFILNKEYKNLISRRNQAGLDKLMIRIFIMQFTIIIGGFIAKITNNPALGISVFGSTTNYL